MKSRKLFLILSLVLTIMTFGVLAVNAAEYSGNCGDYATYEFEELTGTLYIRGEGDIDDNPWCGYVDKINAIVIEEGITSIGKTADYGGLFMECVNLTDVILSDGLEFIGPFTFSGCSKLKSIRIPESVTDIEFHAFECCFSLKDVNIPKGIQYLNESFWHCTSLEDIVLPDGLVSIGGAFYNCTALKNITIPDSVTSIGIFDFAGSGIEEITIPESVTYVDGWAFVDCLNLKTVTFLGDNLDFIGSYAFANCPSLYSIDIPICSDGIMDYAFDCCMNLTFVHYQGNKSQWAAMDIQEGNEMLDRAVIFYNGDTVALCNDTVTSGQDNSYTYSFDMISDKNVTGVFIVGLYSGDQLVAFKIENLTTPVSEHQVSDTIKAEQTADNYKIFLWNGFNAMTPHCECATGTI